MHLKVLCSFRWMSLIAASHKTKTRTTKVHISQDLEVWVLVSDSFRRRNITFRSPGCEENNPQTPCAQKPCSSFDYNENQISWFWGFWFLIWQHYMYLPSKELKNAFSKDCFSFLNLCVPYGDHPPHPCHRIVSATPLTALLVTSLAEPAA